MEEQEDLFEAREEPRPVPPAIRGRGAAENPANRFERIHFEWDPEVFDVGGVAPDTHYLADTSRSIIARNESPDVGFSASINPYRGCEHGCVYCYARPTHEYLGFSAGLDFETRIMVKKEAPALLRKALLAPRWKPEILGISGVTDPYQPVERSLGITRKCLEVLAEFRNPVAVVTKNHLVTRDADHLGNLASHQAALVFLSMTSLDGDLSGRLEPRASAPGRRLEAIAGLRDAGIPAGVLVAPVIPGLNDHEVPAILKAAAEAGAGFASFILLRLPHGVADLFQDWLSRHYPDKQEKIMNKIRSMRAGRLNESDFGTRMRGAGIHAQQLANLFRMACDQAGLAQKGPNLSTEAFLRPGGTQPSLFD